MVGLIRSYYNKNPSTYEYLTAGCIVAIGKFDALHIAHNKIITTAKNLATQSNLPLVIISFYPHPLSILKHINQEELPNTLDLKLRLLKLDTLGVNYLMLQKFNTEFASISPQDFFIFIKKTLNVQAICVGSDFCFGKNKSGNVQILKELCDIDGINLTITEEITNNGLKISTSLVRQMISSGNVDQVKEITQENFKMTGTTAKGMGLAGKVLGFATINFFPKYNIIIPKRGVYATRCLIDKIWYKSITNVGFKPTITDHNSTVIETHILENGFNATNLYGKKIIVEFLKFIREEKKFDSVTSLKEHIKTDVLEVKKYFCI